MLLCWIPLKCNSVNYFSSNCVSNSNWLLNKQKEASSSILTHARTHTFISYLILFTLLKHQMRYRLKDCFHTLTQTWQMWKILIIRAAHRDGIHHRGRGLSLTDSSNSQSTVITAEQSLWLLAFQCMFFDWLSASWFCRPRPQNTVVSPVCAGTCLSACGCFSSFSNSGLLKPIGRSSDFGGEGVALFGVVGGVTRSVLLSSIAGQPYTSYKWSIRQKGWTADAGLVAFTPLHRRFSTSY